MTMAKHVNCVICDAQGTQENEKNFLEREDYILRNNLQVYFFLRHVIKMPSSQIESYLVLCSAGRGGSGKEHGLENMSTWIWFCEDCKLFVLKLEKIYSKIEQLKKEWTKLEELIIFKMVTLTTLKNIHDDDVGDNDEKEPLDTDTDQQAILNISREVREFIKVSKGLPQEDEFNQDCIKTEGKEDYWLVVEDADDDGRFSRTRQDNNEDNYDCDKDDDYELPSSKCSKIKKRKKTTLPWSQHRSSGDDHLEQQEVEEDQEKLENVWKCNIETCPKRNIETMTVDQFLDHWGIHKRQKWRCTKCGRHFPSGITRKSHWALRHSKIIKSVPEETWFEEICPVMPTIKWPCPLFPDCTEKFAEPEVRSTHVSINHPNNPLEQICNKCEIKFWTEDELKFHVNTVHKEIRLKRVGTRSRGNFNCADCPEKFNTAIKLQQHRIREHGKGSFKCEICGNEYKFRETLTNHLSFAHGQRGRKDREPHICKICGKEFPWKVNLVQHLAGVHKMDNLACEICGASVPRHLLEKHLFKEHGIGNVKHWICEMDNCGKIFYKKYDLKFHQRNTHEKGKVAPEFQCEECGKGFHVKTYLNSHMKLHKGKEELPWQCDKCERKFAREDYLRNHKASQHGEGQLVNRKRKKTG